MVSIAHQAQKINGRNVPSPPGKFVNCMNQRETIPVGKSTRKYAETLVGSLPTGVSFVPFCPFPGLSAFYPRMGQRMGQGKNCPPLSAPNGSKWVCPIGRPIFFPFDQELRRSRQRLRSPIRILKLLRDKNSENKGVSRLTSVFISAIRPAGPSGRCRRPGRPVQSGSSGRSC